MNSESILSQEAARLPYSSLVSDEAKEILTRPGRGGGGGNAAIADIVERRRAINEGLQPNIAHMRELYPVDVEETMMGGISVAVVTPKGGVPAANRNRVMLNVPGGGFVTAVRGNGLLISIPVSSLAKVKVVTALYRQGPEHRYPAASDDLTAVYRELLKTYRAPNIGMVGCSAGASTISHAVASYIANGTPLPGVLGLYCAGTDDYVGDSTAFSAFASGAGGRGGGGGGAGISGMAYFQGIDVHQPGIQPARHDRVIAKFPPTLLATGTRDFAMSAAAYTHRRLRKFDVESDLLVFDGMGHGFMTNPNLPESKELYETAAKFYLKHLGK